ncbi:NYN domain-containing protein [Cytobacillus praedii]|uniref:NYN domain-containing protein n=1 Tax=Cytobacillus praedii TaxID=1742358 RepID=UPI002E243F64|nr:NYN domain-containing protein [Cytobacillus praedii]MED3576021.1 NYN domain-containing protein [Cytobacillus praedii]
MTKIAILVDEMNAMAQLHELGVKGIRPWSQFYKAIEEHFTTTKTPAECHFYCANIPEKLDSQRHHLREGFFKALIRDGITVHKGFAVLDRNKRLIEKGVDVLLSLDLVDLSLEGFDEIIVFSADGDIVPAIQRARANGAIVKAVLSFTMPAGNIAESVDEIIRLKDVLKFIPSIHLLELKNPNMKESVVA